MLRLGCCSPLKWYTSIDHDKFNKCWTERQIGKVVKLSGTGHSPDSKLQFEEFLD